MDGTFSQDHCVLFRIAGVFCAFSTHNTCRKAGRRSFYITAFSVGRLVSDPELKTSAKNKRYLRLILEEQTGYGEYVRTQQVEVWAWNALVEQLRKAHVGSGSLIWVFGSLELADYKRKDGITRDKSLKLFLKQWGFAGSRITAGKAFTKPDDFGSAEVVDGDRESLPA